MVERNLSFQDIQELRTDRVALNNRRKDRRVSINSVMEPSLERRKRERRNNSKPNKMS